MYGIIFVFPQRGATKNTTPRLMTMHSEPHTRNPGERNSFLKAAMVVTLCCSGAFKARMVAPIMHNMQPIQPCHVSATPPLRQRKHTKKLRDSFKKKWERMAQMTTDKAPIGVTRIASVKALESEYQNSSRRRTH